MRRHPTTTPRRFGIAMLLNCLFTAAAVISLLLCPLVVIMYRRAEQEFAAGMAANRRLAGRGHFHDTYVIFREHIFSTKHDIALFCVLPGDRKSVV